MFEMMLTIGLLGMAVVILPRLGELKGKKKQKGKRGY